MSDWALSLELNLQIRMDHSRFFDIEEEDFFGENELSVYSLPLETYKALFEFYGYNFGNYLRDHFYKKTAISQRESIDDYRSKLLLNISNVIERISKD